MSSEARSGWAIPWPVITSVIALGSGLLWYTKPLTSSRPPGQPGPVMSYIGDQDVSARLWQDPFAAAHEHDTTRATAIAKRTANTEAATRAATPDRYTSAEMATFIESTQADETGKGGNLLVLPVMVDGGPFPDATELRVRTRSAVLHALGVSGFVPADGDHIGYFKVAPWPTAAQFTSQRTASHPVGAVEARGTSEVPPPVARGDDVPTLLVPYEVLGPRFAARDLAGSGSASRVLLLWLRDEAFKDLPLARLARLLDELRLSPRFCSDVTVKVIGPRTSTTLRALAIEVAGAAAVAPAAFPAEFTIYAGTPTASDVLLTHRLQLAAEREDAVRRQGGDTRRVEDLFRAWAGDQKHRLVRTIASDDAVCRALVVELRRRGVDVLNGRDHVAVVSEWDTFYGRALPVTFAAAARRIARDRSRYDRFAAADTNVFPPGAAEGWIHTFSYLRGIDGKVPQAAGSGSRTPGQPQNTQLVEPPEGLDQGDYLRRLAADLGRLDRRLRNDGKDGLKAIGVLGSDVYDRLLVLTALRRAFPGAIYFTNNLDARLVHPAEWEATHNLIVASPFGLSLHPGYQRNIAPFRDSYQTSVYATVLAAMGRVAKEDALRAGMVPRVFEIGRSGPVDLSPRPARGTLALHPVAGGFWEWWTLGRAVLAAAMGALLVVMVVAWVKFPRPGAGSRRSGAATPISWKLKTRTDIVVPIALALAGAVVILLLVVQWVLGGGRSGEPFAWFEGVSIWPTELLRILTALLCVHFIVRSHHLMEENAEELEKDLLPMPPRDARPGDRTKPNEALSSFRDAHPWVGWIKEEGAAAMALGRDAVPTGITAPMTDPMPSSPPTPARAPAGVTFNERLPARTPAKPSGGVAAVSATATAAPSASRITAVVPEDTPDGDPAGAALAPAPQTTASRAAWHLRVGRWLADRCRDMPLLPWDVVDDAGRVAARKVWDAYRADGTPARRAARILPMLIAYYGAGAMLMAMFGFPHVPYRGAFSARADALITLAIAVPASIVLMMYVLDAMRLSEHFINRLACTGGVAWPTEVVGKRTRKALQPEEVGEYLNIELIARRSHVVSPLIYYPFVVFLLMTMSRLAYFDNWDWPVGLVVILGSNCVFALVAAWVMRRAAERARSKALGRLRDRQLLALSQGDERADALASLMGEIRAVRAGSFAPLSHHPIIGAVLLPSSGLGVWALIDVVVKAVG